MPCKKLWKKTSITFTLSILLAGFTTAVRSDMKDSQFCQKMQALDWSDQKKIENLLHVKNSFYPEKDTTKSIIQSIKQNIGNVHFDKDFVNAVESLDKSGVWIDYMPEIGVISVTSTPGSDQCLANSWGRKINNTIKILKTKPFIDADMNSSCYVDRDFGVYDGVPVIIVWGYNVDQQANMRSDLNGMTYIAIADPKKWQNGCKIKWKP